MSLGTYEACILHSDRWAWNLLSLALYKDKRTQPRSAHLSRISPDILHNIKERIDNDNEEIAVEEADTNTVLHNVSYIARDIIDDI